MSPLFESMADVIVSHCESCYVWGCCGITSVSVAFYLLYFELFSEDSKWYIKIMYVQCWSVKYRVKHLLKFK